METNRRSTYIFSVTSFPPSFLDEIKNRLRASDVIGRYVALKKAGREWRGLSPFRKERTPSFFVNDEKAAFFDFSSGTHGDIFKFLMLTQNRSFPEAVEELAALAGLEVPRQSEDDRRRASDAEILRDLLAEAANFFRAELMSAEGGDARAYLRRRQVSAASVDAFGLGYAPPGWERLRRHFLGRGVGDEMLVRAGLLIRRDDGSTYDRFRNRLMFPIRDSRGRVIAFGGRALSPDDTAKYLNSPETEVFHKGRVLYNFGRARDRLKGGAPLLVCEGYMDALALDVPVFAAVAPLGTAWTRDQLRLLWRVEPAPVLCFDGDRAGRDAAERVLDRALPLLTPRQSLRFVFMPEGQDPDDIVRKSGPAAMEALVSARTDPEETMWRLALARHRTDSAEQIAGLENELRQRAARVGDPPMRDALHRAFKDRLYSLRGELYVRKRYRRRALGDRQREPARLSPALRDKLGQGGTGAPNSTPREAQLVLALVHHPHLFGEFETEILNLEVHDRDLAQLLKRTVDLLVATPDLDSETLRSQLSDCSAVYSVYQRWSKDPLVRITRFVRQDAEADAAKAGWLDAFRIDQRHKVLSAEVNEAGAEAHMDMAREKIWLKSVQLSLDGGAADTNSKDGDGETVARPIPTDKREQGAE